MSHKNCRYLLTSILLMLVSVMTWSQIALAGDMSGLRGQRYCEIFFVKTDKIIPKDISVYNTIGLNECPADAWNKITPEEIKKETGAKMVHLNGPRYWVIDGMKNSTLLNPKPRVLGGIAMREAGVLEMDFPILQSLKGAQPYQEHHVHRNTTWVYAAGKPVYELIDPEGKVYVMQSYSIQKINQTEESLANLGSKLKLPKGWHFRTYTLKKEKYLTPMDKNAVVIQDNFLNTYQLEAPKNGE